MTTDKTTLDICCGRQIDEVADLRAVERATGVSNAYLSQLESGQDPAPSPVVWHKLRALRAALRDHHGARRLSTLTERDRDGGPSSTRGWADHHRRGTRPREYLEFLRSRRGRKDDG